MTGWANTGSTAIFKSMVDTNDDRAVWDEGADQGVQQGACELPPRPAVPIERAVEGGEAGLTNQTEGAQEVGNGVGSNRQHRSDRERGHRTLVHKARAGGGREGERV